MKRTYFEYFIDRLEEKGPLQETILGHLVLEYLLVQALKVRGVPESEINKLNFPKKIEKAVSLKIIPTNHKNIFLKINDLRNNYSHQLDYELTFKEIHSIIKEAIESGIDFSDERIYDEKIAKEEYGIDICLSELLGNISIRLIIFLYDHGIKIPC